MNDRGAGKPKFSVLSERAGELRPGRRVFCSKEAGWQSVLLQIYEQPSAVEPFETAASPDQLLVVVLQGSYEIESYSAGAWKRAMYSPGSAGLTAPMSSNRLRWRSRTDHELQILRIYIPQAYFADAEEEYRRPGARTSKGYPDSLAFRDPVVFSVATALAQAMRQGVPDLYADAGARFLAMHLLSTMHRWSDPKSGGRSFGQDLTDRRLLRVLEFMQHHCAEPVTLQHLAAEACVSPFHFARMFKAKMGVSPHQHVVHLRMNEAKRLLVETGLPVAQIALACGYSHGGHFATAFRRESGMSPLLYRTGAQATRKSARLG